jgi:hypothetical protein
MNHYRVRTELKNTTKFKDGSIKHRYKWCGETEYSEVKDFEVFIMAKNKVEAYLTMIEGLLGCSHGEVIISEPLEV